MRTDTRGSVGSALETVRSELLELSERLSTRFEGSARTFLHDSHCLLQTMVCRIAVVGQIKAGKSSFTNALIRRPGMLPTDVNPWTTAVTRIHLARRDAPRDVAAEFRFFELDEWQRLAEGGGRLRELTERLVPGFEAAQLARQLMEMRHRTEARLGSEFTRILGTCHRFPSVDRETLEAYVCSGRRTPVPGAALAPGKYADITKTADLYLNSGPFAFPTTIVDTPGTNDPFLVRDEITRQILDTADLYIVVLTARQALAAADVALMRILRGLRKDRMIVFVNRIDELDNLESDLRAVRLQVEQGIQREFPGLAIPIVYGSARLANQVLSGETLNLPGALSRYASGLTRGHADGPSSGDEGDATAARAQDLLFECSGFPRLTRTLDRYLLQSEPARVLQNVVTRFAAHARVNAVTTCDELRRRASTIEDGAKAKEALAGELERLGAAAQRIEQSVVEFESTLKTMVADDLRVLETTLAETVEQYAQTECRRLEEAIRMGNRQRVWRCEPARLRQRLEEEFWRQHRSIEGKILRAEAEIMPSLQQAVAHFLPAELRAEALGLRLTPAGLPRIGALGQAVALDLDETWWKGWWMRNQSSDERAHELAQLIRYESMPMADSLAAKAREHLLGMVAATIQQIKTASLNVVEQMRKQCSDQKERLSKTAAAGAEVHLSAQGADDILQLQDRLKVWDSIYARLGVLDAVFAQPE
jgi:Dynamin family